MEQVFGGQMSFLANHLGLGKTGRDAGSGTSSEAVEFRLSTSGDASPKRGSEQFFTAGKQ